MCNTYKDTIDFYLSNTSWCKDCTKAYNRDRYKDPSVKSKRKEREEKLKVTDPEYKSKRKTIGKKFYESTRGRALTLLKSAGRRSHKFSEIMDVDYNFIKQRLDLGVCEVTGIHFDFTSGENHKNAYSPSIDRIDSKRGYTKDNTRIVIWQYNLMKGELSDEELLLICKLLVERNK